MDLNGVTPGPMTYFRSMFACMKSRRLGDTLYYWERMQQAGIQPDVPNPLLVPSPLAHSLAPCSFPHPCLNLLLNAVALDEFV